MKISTMSLCPLRWLTYRYFIYGAISLFFLNIILILHVADLHLYVQQLFQDMQWTDMSYIEGTTRYTRSTFECVINDSLALSALSRMRTESCRQKARRLICTQSETIPDALPNRCPLYAESQRGAYVGCFKDTRSARVLSGHLYSLKQINSPHYCVNLCLRAGYMYAGVEYREECFCGDSLRNAPKLSHTECDRFTCPNNNLTKCGGYEAISIFTTGITDKSVNLVSYVEPQSTAPSDVQILFLLQLNGRHVRQVMRMLRVIYSPKHLYVIHVDSRQQFMHSEMEKLAMRMKKAGLDNVHVMEQRYATIWGAASLLTMFLDAVRNAEDKKGWHQWDFILNLSETDFPLLSLKELELHLARNKGRNFLSSHGYDTARFIQKQGLDFLFLECENRMWRLGKRLKFPSRVRLDGGSDWVVLTRDFTMFALSQDPLARGLRDIFANVLLPVEGFFHTLAINSEYCSSIVKGNLHLANWKRKQGCRCAMLRKLVDWCGCSPLVFSVRDTAKFALEVAKKKVIFFGRKFDSFISASAIAIAESQAFRHTPEMIDVKHASFTRSWLNFYDSTVDNSVLLISWARVITEIPSFAPSLSECRFSRLLSLYAYKQNDDSEVETIVDCTMRCSVGMIRAEILVSPKIGVSRPSETIVDGYMLVDAKFGADLDLKEEVFRNFPTLLSTEDTIIAKLRWERVENASTSVSANFSSPIVDAQWTDPLGRLVKATTIPPYDSIYGSQFADLLPNETIVGEWQLDFWAPSRHSQREHLLSMKFAIFPADGVDMRLDLIEKYFRMIDVCINSTLINSLSLCSETLWSRS
uniref:protein xylosyltransferase n=2 Tax=Parascaris univalens TaxID=6257 RepID=A0A915B3N6_PARUN